MRSFKKSNTPILNGVQICHNYIIGHQALKGKTSAEKGGIEIKDDNKWKTHIENASRN